MDLKMIPDPFDCPEDLAIKRVEDDMLMTYWGSIAGGPLGDQENTLSGLLRHRDGKCDSWAEFYIAALKAQGIDARKYGITPDPAAFGRDYDPIAQSYTLTGFTVRSKNLGQGTLPNINTGFLDHAVVRLVDTGFGGVFDRPEVFDPSYGKFFSGNSVDAEQGWIDAAIDLIILDSSNPALPQRQEPHDDGVDDMVFTPR